MSDQNPVYEMLAAAMQANGVVSRQDPREAILIHSGASVDAIFHLAAVVSDWLRYWHGRWSVWATGPDARSGHWLPGSLTG